MARHVKASILGSASLSASGSNDADQWVRLRDAWLTRFDRVAPDEPDLIVLPEYCGSMVTKSADTGQTYVSPHDDKLIPFFQEQARKLNAHVSFTLLRKDNQGRQRNTMYLLGRDGQIKGTYDKAHPTELEIENGTVPGNPAIIECEFGSVVCGICFDLNFDELWQTYAAAQPDLILFPSVYHGGMMQAYRAYQCRSHLISAIGGGTFKPSHVIAPNGHIIASTTHYHDFVTTTINLDCRLVHLDFHAGKLAVMKRELGKAVHIADVDHLGSVLVTNEDNTKNVDQILAKYDIVVLDQYMARARDAQLKCRATND